ncbi:hypothetical protein ACFSR7_35925 [Cohnella sp. GCM10020058]|uniref:hypothetical protein n=1 Tax=Cohnella sp. GCM10020058 TaxID=3317330 RepID=UPI003638E024
MKQRITVEQFNALSEKKKRKLVDLWRPERGDLFYNPERNLVQIVDAASDEGIESSGELIPKYNCKPLLSIGQMICLIKDLLEEKSGREYYKFGDIIGDIEVWVLPELCDALWEEVKISIS